MITVGCCCLCGNYCKPNEQIIVRPCYHIFHAVCYGYAIGNGARESVMYCPANGCQTGRPPFCGGCYHPIFCDEPNILSLPCGHHFHQPCYDGRLICMNKEYGTCPSSRCIPMIPRQSDGKRSHEESDSDDGTGNGQGQQGTNDTTETNEFSKNKRIRTNSSEQKSSA